MFGAGWRLVAQRAASAANGDGAGSGSQSTFQFSAGWSKLAATLTCDNSQQDISSSSSSTALATIENHQPKSRGRPLGTYGSHAMRASLKQAMPTKPASNKTSNSDVFIRTHWRSEHYVQ